VRRKALAELELLVSGKKLIPRGAHKLARDAFAVLERALKDAEAAASLAEAHLAELARLRDEAAVLAAPGTAAARQLLLTTIDRQIAEDDRLAQDIAVQTERRNHLEAQAAQRAETWQRLQQGFDDHERINSELAQASTAASSLGREVEALRASAEQATARLAAAHAAETSLAARVADASRQAEIEHLAARVANAEAVAAERQTLVDKLARIAVTPEILDRIDLESRAVTILEGRVAANVPTVAVTIERTGIGRVLVGGRPLEVDTVFRPTAPLSISIPGVASIQVSQPADEAHDDLEADLAAHQQTLARLLSDAGARDVASARALAGERLAVERAIDGLATRFSTLVPEGLDEARRALAALGPAGASTEACVDDLRAQHAAATSAASEGAVEAAIAQSALAEATTRKAVEEARLDERRRALAKLAAELPLSSDRALRLAEAKSTAEAARAKATEAADAVSLLSRRRLPAGERQRLLAQRIEVENEHARTERRQRDIERESSRLEGLIESEAEAATGPELDRLRAETARARREVHRFEAEIAGLTLLARTLGEVAEEATSAYLQPVLRRLVPHLAELLDAEAMAVTGDLGVSGIVRGNRAEAGDRLSTGTREQIAVLVRLAFADILAAAGRPVPFVLDDALVYSDDNRLARMLRILRNASRNHQVILLSCRTRVLREEGFRPLVLRPWSP
jgi:hypothetical protein